MKCLPTRFLLNSPHSLRRGSEDCWRRVAEGNLWTFTEIINFRNNSSLSQRTIAFIIKDFRVDSLNVQSRDFKFRNSLRIIAVWTILYSITTGANTIDSIFVIIVWGRSVIISLGRLGSCVIKRLLIFFRFICHGFFVMRFIIVLARRCCRFLRLISVPESRKRQGDGDDDRQEDWMGDEHYVRWQQAHRLVMARLVGVGPGRRRGHPVSGKVVKRRPKFE